MHSHHSSPSQDFSHSPTATSESSKRRFLGLLDSKEALSIFKAFVIICLGTVVVSIGILNPRDVLRTRQQFRNWYPQYGNQFRFTARTHCTEEYSIYLYGTYQNTTTDSQSGSNSYTLFLQPMISCLLQNSSEYIKDQMNTSQVMLGITPTIIALLGASSEELCLLALLGKRRLLGLLLAMASPSIYTERAFKYRDPAKILRERQYGRRDSLDQGNGNGSGGEHVMTTSVSKRRWIFVLLEYFAACVAVVNMGTLNWQLGVNSINAINPNTVFMPLLWSLLGLIIHLGGALVFNMRARRLDKGNHTSPSSTFNSSLEPDKAQGSLSAIAKLPNAFKKMVNRELGWDNEGENQKIRFRLIPESRSFALLASTLSVFVVFHIVFGTLILSGALFVGPRDALGIMMRYITSVIICRVILVYELAVLRVEHGNATGGRFEASSTRSESKSKTTVEETDPEHTEENIAQQGERPTQQEMKLAQQVTQRVQQQGSQPRTSRPWSYPEPLPA